MGLTASRDCLCGYQFPEWAVRKAEATREAAASIENGEFGTVEFARDADPMSIVLETSTGNFYFKHWKIEI